MKTTLITVTSPSVKVPGSQFPVLSLKQEPQARRQVAEKTSRQLPRPSLEQTQTLPGADPEPPKRKCNAESKRKCNAEPKRKCNAEPKRKCNAKLPTRKALGNQFLAFSLEREPQADPTEEDKLPTRKALGNQFLVFSLEQEPQADPTEEDKSPTRTALGHQFLASSLEREPQTDSN